MTSSNKKWLIWEEAFIVLINWLIKRRKHKEMGSREKPRIVNLLQGPETTLAPC